MLIHVHCADPGKIEVIANGFPYVPLASARAAKERLGFSDRKVILTFGLMSPNKGIETMIEAMPEIVRRTPDVLYVVMGATHTALLAREDRKGVGQGKSVSVRVDPGGRREIKTKK